MSKALPIVVAALLGGAALAPIYYATQNPADVSQSQAKKDAKPVEKISYALGYQVASQTPSEVDINTFVLGIRDAHAKKERAYTEEELQAAANEFQKEQLKTAQDKAKDSDSFLKENAKKAGISQTESGLQYKITQAGTGKQPQADSTVRVHYTGKLVNGTVFDSSVERGEPIEFPLNQVIPGWTEGLQLMKEGGKATLYIPSYLAYADQEIPGIPANSTLIFDVELLEVK